MCQYFLEEKKKKCAAVQSFILQSYPRILLTTKSRCKSKKKTEKVFRKSKRTTRQQAFMVFYAFGSLFHVKLKVDNIKET